MRQCQHCQNLIPAERNAKAKYCTIKCSRDANRNHSTEPCSKAECAKTVRAKGLCATHYNREHQPNRHAKKLIPCAWCGTEVLKHSGGGRKYGPVCSDQCRQYLATPYCVLPKDHWARWYGKSSTWTPPDAKQPKPDIPAFIANICDECGNHFVEANNYNPSAYCSKRCSRRVSKRARNAREHNSPGSFRWIEVIRIWIAAGKQCSYCDVVMTEHPDPDHVTPISRGGRNDIGNIVPCCRSCNADKNDLTLDEWATERARLGKPARRYSLPYEDPRFTHLTMGEATGSAWRHAMRLAA